MIAIYYQGGVYKNFAFNLWEKRTIRLRDGSTETFYDNKFSMPENWCNRRLTPNLHVVIEPAANTVEVDNLRVYPPSQCGASVMTCVDQVFTGQGWLSLGLTIGVNVKPSSVFRVRCLGLSLMSANFLFLTQ